MEKLKEIMRHPRCTRTHVGHVTLEKQIGIIVWHKGREGIEKSRTFAEGDISLLDKMVEEALEYLNNLDSSNKVADLF